MNIWKTIIIGFAIVLAGCSGGSNDDASVKGLPEKAPVTKDQQEKAQQAISNDPKAAGDAPRPDGK